ncbi:L-pipecolate oxidase [Lachnellula arida]|uniref:L-pipecolate oxidase n=1 Tax=Lachnellula arida TaxID=1316785 RepID=A0A8T9B8U4_9HELO|nr:L-pipecolate oxidase [Lachnellula arida]
MTPPLPPGEILILGSGVFGLSTALALTQRPAFKSSKITVVDRSIFPAPDGSSIDTSRIIRPDYASPPYAHLASTAQSLWRTPSSPFSTAYTESGLVLVANTNSSGLPYVRDSFANVKALLPNPGDVEELRGRRAIEKEVGTGGGSGDWGYVNRRSGWADAEAGMRILRGMVEETGRVTFLTRTVTSLIYSSTTSTSTSTPSTSPRVLGAKFADGTSISADLVIAALGAWTPSLIDLRGRAQATGQVLCYLPLSAREQEELNSMPVLLNMSTGMFIIPPRNRVLKVACHGYGYSNPVSISIPTPEPEASRKVSVSIPRTATDDPNLWVPEEGERECRRALREMIPALADRPFTKSKICWYTDTPDGDFLITYHPSYSGLFLATGGSGHGYKFLPVIGEKIVDTIEGNCPEEFKNKWAWREEAVENVVTEDGSRGGKPGMVLDVEMGKGSKL